MAAVILGGCQGPASSGAPRVSAIVKSTKDFEVTGKGTNGAWDRAEWVALQRRQTDGHPYDARFKALYSPTGLYFLMDGTDRKITATLQEDFKDLWTEDVYEVFLWPDERHPVYFEYEISPLNHELPILVYNIDGKFHGWRPWRDGPDRKTRRAVSVTGNVEGWRAEFFIPYKLLIPLGNVPPAPGARWRANFYRVDYDDGKMTQWGWARVGPSFHEIEKFGVLIFE